MCGFFYIRDDIHKHVQSNVLQYTLCHLKVKVNLVRDTFAYCHLKVKVNIYFATTYDNNKKWKFGQYDLHTQVRY